MRIAFRRLVATMTLSFLGAPAALAQSVGDSTGLNASANEAGFSTNVQPLAVIVGNLIGGLLSLLGVVFLVLIIYGGFTRMTAQGEQDKIKKSKGIMTSAVIGLVVIFASYAITQAVISAIGVTVNQGS